MRLRGKAYNNDVASKKVAIGTAESEPCCPEHDEHEKGACLSLRLAASIMKLLCNELRSWARGHWAGQDKIHLRKVRR